MDIPEPKAKTPDDGGPAFPAEGTFSDDGVRVKILTPSANGMSLRDYFAAASLQGQRASDVEDWNSLDRPKMAATQAYIDADAMLAERAKR